MSKLIDEQSELYKSQLEEAVTTLLGITKSIENAELEKTVSDIKDRLSDPYMFVIVGEVKAGKSSFINALLESKKEICKVAASPMTDTIQQIVYGEIEKVESINPFLKRIHQPVEILKEIAIVDTPGTNTIIDHHQEITENFIPASDLIVFVFESKNPYRQSSWDFFDFIKEEWRKKIIFVLQQKDLMNADDLATNIQGVKDYAAKKGIMDARVFPVSALLELQDKYEESGFKAIRSYIYDNITGGKSSYLKMINNADTALNINEKIHKGVLTRKSQLDADVRFRNDIKESLDHQEEKTKRQVGILVENLVAAYDRTTNGKLEELKEGIGFFNMIKRSLQSTFAKGTSPKDWLNSLTKELESDLNKEFKEKLQDGVMDIADSIQTMGKLIDAKIKNSETILKNNHEIFSDIAERRTNVLHDLQNTFAGFLKSSENFYDKELMQGGEKIGPNLAAGSGIAVVGIIISTLTNTMVVDITGGVLTAIGFIFAGITIGLNRSKIIKAYQKEVDKGRLKIEAEITTKLNNYTAKIKSKINDNFYRFDKLLQEETATIQSLENEQDRIESNLNTIKDAITKENL